MRGSKTLPGIPFEPLSDEQARRAFAPDAKAKAFEMVMSQAQSFRSPGTEAGAERWVPETDELKRDWTGGV